MMGRHVLNLDSTESTFIFTIDDHMLQVISSDFVPIKPYYNESILIGIGMSTSNEGTVPLSALNGFLQDSATLSSWKPNL
jgi:hypothetical protein